MNLTTHWILAFALGISLFQNVQIALIMSIGALIPDLDREYLFVVKNFIGRHQLHRSLFHNFFIIGVMYFVNPFLSFGALTHSLLDMFTSATDRGVELLFPLTRIVKHFNYNIEGQKSDQSKHVVWWVEDPWRLLQQTSDRDLQEPKEQAWRRSYGPFKNSRVVDWAIFFGSIFYLIVASLAFGDSLYSLAGFNSLVMVSFIGISVFYGLGEWWRRKLIGSRTEETNWMVFGILVLGLIAFVAGGAYFFQPPRLPDLRLFGLAVASLVVGLFMSYAFMKARKKDDLSL